MRDSTRSLLNHVHFTGDIWDPCSRNGYLSKQLSFLPQEIISSDLSGNFGSHFDFLSPKNKLSNPFNIITQPPVSLCYNFLCKALDITDTGKKIVFFLPNLQLIDACPMPNKIILIDRKDYEGWAWFVWQKP